MQLTPHLLQQIAPVSDKAAAVFTPHLNEWMGDVGTPLRMAAFLANVLVESGCLRYVHELASGHEYEDRKDLGNIHPGDGPRYKGRGLIQITGRYNYASCSKDLFGNEDVLLLTPDLLATPENATRSAYWFWNLHHLNTPADARDMLHCIHTINGGTNGLKERMAYYEQGVRVLGG